MNKLYLIAAGLGGAIIGSAVTFVVTNLVVKKKYEKLANDAIDQYKAKDEVVDDKVEVIVKNPGKDFSKYNTTTKTVPEKVTIKPVDKTKPFVINHKQYKELGDEYDEIALYYYADDVLADDMTNDVIKEKEWPDTVGTDFVHCFGNDEDPDLVYVQNDRLKVKYEIARSLKYYYLDEVGK